MILTILIFLKKYRNQKNEPNNPLINKKQALQEDYFNINNKVLNIEPVNFYTTSNILLY